MAERTKMPRADRAKQFNPFDALKGLQEALRMKEYEHERKAKEGITEEEIQAMTKTLLEITKQDTVQVKFFEDGHYFTIQGKSKIDFNEKTIELDRKKINFDDIKEIKII